MAHKDGESHGGPDGNRHETPETEARLDPRERGDVEEVSQEKGDQPAYTTKLNDSKA